MEMKDFNPENTVGAPEALRTCSCCHRQLPLDHFYLHSPGGRPEGRCKDCHRRAVRMRRKLAAADPAVDEGRTDLFRVDDRDWRLELIRRAKQVVRLSMERRARRLREWEWEQETKDWTD